MESCVYPGYSGLASNGEISLVQSGLSSGWLRLWCLLVAYEAPATFHSPTPCILTLLRLYSSVVIGVKWFSLADGRRDLGWYVGLRSAFLRRVLVLVSPVLVFTHCVGGIVMLPSSFWIPRRIATALCGSVWVGTSVVVAGSGCSKAGRPCRFVQD
ncbi:hypothetical protein LOK49_LG03G03882 [Camellia lanceoleosa]|uniref:Uncharacterized protein n=1 Tax=Camellia lanceoleosa TaxID=1840588 RepID=A0ACC0IG68_9ERIC|nr:hypothetical protein LOK49_LG03G03882 [Camellia lanceoleosa]